MSDIQEPTEREMIQKYAWSSGTRTNDLRIALKSLSTVRLLLNKPSADYSNVELHPLTEQVDKLYEQLEDEMLSNSGQTGRMMRHRLQRDRGLIEKESE
tara:strand:+ start:592 stop:888 length:297 start_codon:yes stop_codon:yes gene_type:complete